ncbi:MAG: glutathione S-transferase family protein [Roseiarcus sp.]|jgi:glutathione S-transferase
MITLHKFGPGFGMPDPSPFVLKAEVLLKLAGAPYEVDFGGLGKAPKGKLPFIRDDGETIADSTFIRFHLERKYRFDFDRGLDAEQKGVAWAVEKMCEDHLYWTLVDARWLDPANFARGPAAILRRAPAPIRPIVKSVVLRKLRKTLIAHGIGRHSRREIEELAGRDLAAIAAILGDKPYLMGAEPHGVDATVFGAVGSCLSRAFETPIRAAAESHANLVAYCDRMMQRFYPDFAG